MKTLQLISILGVLLFFQSHLQAQLNVTGYTQSSLYSLEDRDGFQQNNFYQAFQLGISPAGLSGLKISTYLRVARLENPEDWQERIYNLYASWNSPGWLVSLRLGRQFLYSGVINGTVDGLTVGIRPRKDFHVKLVAGVAAPFSREFKVNDWDSGNVFGAYMDYRWSQAIRFTGSYFQKVTDGETVWQIAGISLNGMLNRSWYYQGQFDYNLQLTDLQGMRYRITYIKDKWSLSGEFNSQKPRVYEDSYFKIFEINAYNQFRGIVSYRFKPVELSLQYNYTFYQENETNQQWIISAGNRWGVVGVLYQNGFGGDNAGVYGQMQFELFHGVTLFLNSSYYNYQRHAVQISEEATAFRGGFLFALPGGVQLRTELQESVNSYFKNDWRGLAQLTYRIGG